MEDLSNLSFGISTNLPPPDQSTDNNSAPGQAVGAAGTSTTTGSKVVGGSTSGVDASKGAITETGANSLIVDQGVESLMTTGISSNTSLDNPENAFFTTPPNFSIDPQTQIAALDGEINNLNEIGPTFGLASLAVTSALTDTISSSSAAGKIKGSEGTRTEKGERHGDGKKAEGKGKGTAEEASPSAGDSVSKTVSPTGEVTTTLSTQTVNASTGSVTTSTTTTGSGGSSSSNQGTTSSTSSEPTTEGTISMTQIMDEIGGLESQESQTMAQQQTSEIAAINLQAKDTMAGAEKLMQGAAMMMTMATVGLAASMATSAYQMGGIGSASKEGDEADMNSLNEHQESLDNTSESTMESMEASSKNAGSAEAHVNAQKSAIQLRSLARDKKTPDNIRDQANSVADNSDGVSRNAAYTTGGTKAATDYVGTPAQKQASEDATAAARAIDPKSPPVEINDPDKAVEFYQKQAAASHKTLKTSISNYKTALSGKTISDDAAKSAIYESWPKDKQESYDAADEAGKSSMIDGPAKEYKANISNIKINRNSSAWNQAYQNRSQQIQIYAGTGQALSQVFNQAGNMEEQIAQAQQQQYSAAAQVEGSTEQAMAQGVQQTQSLAEQFRQSQTAVAQDMQSMVGSTKV